MSEKSVSVRELADFMQELSRPLAETGECPQVTVQDVADEWAVIAEIGKRFVHLSFRGLEEQWQHREFLVKDVRRALAGIEPPEGE